MISPKLFIPKQRLEIPEGADAEVAIMTVMDTELIKVPLGAVAVMSMHFAEVPSWKPWEDETGGVLQIQTHTGEPLPLFIREDGRRASVPSTDGVTMRNEDPMLLTYGVDGQDGSCKVFWGAMTHDLEQLLQMSHDVNFQPIVSKTPWHDAHFERMFPK